MTELAGSVPSEKTLGMLEDLMHKLRKGAITERQFDRFLKKENPFATPDSKAGEWAAFYQDVFGLEKDFSNLSIPPERDGFGWLIVAAAGLTLNQVFTKCAERMRAWRWTENLDKATPQNDRVPKTDYCLWVRDRVEADEENKNLSANQLAEKDISGITLLERLILELFYFWKSRGQHLDLQNVTLCTGSRGSDGDVPGVGWGSDDGLGVDWFGPAHHGGRLRARAVVSA